MGGKWCEEELEIFLHCKKYINITKSLQGEPVIKFGCHAG